MKFRNYCIVVMGDTLGVQAEIQKISEITPNILDAKGILIATFSSLAEPSELREWFMENKRNFLVFDLDKDSSAYHIFKTNVHEGLFGFLRDVNPVEMTENFSKTIEFSSNTNTKTIKTKPNTLTLEQQLKDALDKEDYEKAAEIRDILNKENQA